MNIEKIARAVGDFVAGFASGSSEVTKLTNAQETAMRRWPAEKLHNGDWKTFCNFGLIDICHDVAGCRDFDGLMASQIVHQCESGMEHDWKSCSWMEAADWAMRGKLAFMGWANPRAGGHGHVATVAARNMVLSPSWGIYVPVLANVGKPPNDFKFASACFLSSERPDIKCFKYAP